MKRKIYMIWVFFFSVSLFANLWALDEPVFLDKYGNMNRMMAMNMKEIDSLTDRLEAYSRGNKFGFTDISRCAEKVLSGNRHESIARLMRDVHADIAAGMQWMRMNLSGKYRAVLGPLDKKYAAYKLLFEAALYPSGSCGEYTSMIAKLKKAYIVARRQTTSSLKEAGITGISTKNLSAEKGPMLVETLKGKVYVGMGLYGLIRAGYTTERLISYQKKNGKAIITFHNRELYAPEAAENEGTRDNRAANREMINFILSGGKVTDFYYGMQK